MPDPQDHELASYDFELPVAQIAQQPPDTRDGARLMELGRTTGRVQHRRIDQLVDLLTGDEVLVLNDTKVVPARLFAIKPTGGRVELLVLGQHGTGTTLEVMAKGAKKLSDGMTLAVLDRNGAPTEATLLVGPRLPNGHLMVTFAPLAEGGLPALWALLEAHGHVPLPPYIRRPTQPQDAAERAQAARDRRRYQTVFAQHRGSVAAPTAGLHLTEAMLQAAVAKGCEVARVTLHVGPGTFAPVRSEALHKHQMHTERYAITQQAADTITAGKAAGRPVLAVGTTVVRTLESSAQYGLLERGQALPAAEARTTQLFLRPGSRFHVVDQLLTNFHLPKSTLLMLVSAFAGRRPVMAAYRQAVEQGYRFFSYGDGMLIR